jgi:hypothetical protein
MCLAAVAARPVLGAVIPTTDRVGLFLLACPESKDIWRAGAV